MTNCKNCESQFEGNFCYQCGQAAKTHPLNFHFVWHDIQHGLFHFDKGVPYTLKALFTRPGHAIREYVEGKRVSFFKPISLLILLGSLYAVIILYFNIRLGIDMDFSKDPEQIAFMKKIESWMQSHYVLYMMLTLPFWTLGSYVSFKQQGYNIVEHFVLNAYIVAQGLVIQFLMLPLTFYYQHRPEQVLFVTISGFLYVIVATWTYVQFFNKLSRVKAICYSLLTYLIMTLSVLILSVIIGFILSKFNII